MPLLRSRRSQTAAQSGLSGLITSYFRTFVQTVIQRRHDDDLRAFFTGFHVENGEECSHVKSGLDSFKKNLLTAINASSVGIDELMKINIRIQK